MGQMYFPDEILKTPFELVGKNGLKYCGTSRPASFKDTDYSYIRNEVDAWDTLRICAMSQNGMCIAIQEGNGYVYQEGACRDGIKKARDNYEVVTDANVTQSGACVLIYGKNGYSHNDAPAKFVERLSKCKNEGTEILSASFNDQGEYCVVTDEHLYYTTSISAFIDNALDKYGDCRYAFLSELGRVAICKRGIYYENIPFIVEQKFRLIDFMPDYIKFTDDGYYCISDKSGNAMYNIC